MSNTTTWRRRPVATDQRPANRVRGRGHRRGQAAADEGLAQVPITNPIQQALTPWRPEYPKIEIA
jgi:hypothetical protein